MSGWEWQQRGRENRAVTTLDRGTRMVRRFWAVQARADTLENEDFTRREQGEG